MSVKHVFGWEGIMSMTLSLTSKGNKRKPREHWGQRGEDSELNQISRKDRKFFPNCHPRPQPTNNRSTITSVIKLAYV